MGSSVPLMVHNYIPETHSRRVLLCNPPVYDTRFPWARYQQPITLLQLSTLLRRCGCDVRLLDALAVASDAPLRRRRMQVLMQNGIPVNKWRFGRLPSELVSQLVALKREKWQPDDVYIEGFTTFWWEGVVEMILMIRRRFPSARVILCGAYPTLAAEHAALQSGADVLAIGQIEGLAGLQLDYSHTSSPPTFSYLSIGTRDRLPCDLVDELLSLASPAQSSRRTCQVAFADHDVVKRFPQQFRAVLERCIDKKSKVNFFALGNLHPRDLVEDPELATLLRRAGFKQLVFADDRGLPLSEQAREGLLDDYHQAIERCKAAGYPQRTEVIVASACLGRPGEDPAEVVAFMTKLAHVAGALMVIPYQPTPAECPSALPLELQNGKLFPFAEENQMTFREYQDILGLGAVLNAKYRSQTFDFLGERLVSRLVRQSLLSESWKPHDKPEHHRPVTVGWFNKEGKWVRS